MQLQSRVLELLVYFMQCSDQSLFNSSGQTVVPPPSGAPRVLFYNKLGWALLGQLLVEQQVLHARNRGREARVVVRGHLFLGLQTKNCCVST